MDLDRFLAQPPEPVQDDGFSRRIMLRLYRRRILHGNVAAAFVIGTMSTLLAVLPVDVLAAELPLRIASLITSSQIPWVVAGTAMLCLAFRPRPRRF